VLNNFKLARLQKGLRQVDLAELVGVSESAVTKWETNRTRPRPEYIEKIEKALGKPFGKLFGDTGRGA
jgi:transcriptional regulator with XRE-family HTH domain